MGDYTGSEQVLVDLWIEARLALFADDLNDISEGLSDRIFLEKAPDKTKYPFIVYNASDPARDVRGVGTTRIMADTLYVVKAVSQAASYDPLVPVTRVIDVAMTSAAGDPVMDGHVLASVREAQVRYPEDSSGTVFRHLGGEYRIYAQAV